MKRRILDPAEWILTNFWRNFGMSWSLWIDYFILLILCIFLAVAVSRKIPMKCLILVFHIWIHIHTLAFSRDHQLLLFFNNSGFEHNVPLSVTEGGIGIRTILRPEKGKKGKNNR